VAASSTTAHHLLAHSDHLRAAVRHHHRFRHPSFDYVGLAVAAFASWVGLPGPGEPVLIAAAVLASEGHLPLLPVLLVAWGAAALGGIIGWAVGWKAGRAILTGPGPLRSIRVKAVARSEPLIESHPVIAVLLVPSWAAGIFRVRASVFHAVNAVSAAVWAGGLGVGAYYAGPVVLDVFNDIGTVLTGIVALVIVAAVTAEVLRRRRRAA
jgi:membrane protein DedA with SNARE-associated domain